MTTDLLRTMLDGLALGLFLGTVSGLLYQIIAGFFHWILGGKE